jgi:hypothetical protein
MCIPNGCGRKGGRKGRRAKRRWKRERTRTMFQNVVEV